MKGEKTPLKRGEPTTTSTELNAIGTENHNSLR